MDCTRCTSKSCRRGDACGIELPPAYALYQESSSQRIVEKAAELVDDGRAGNLSRVQELLEFLVGSGYKKIGIAYCYGMEGLAAKFSDLLHAAGLSYSAVSCTVGALPQKEVNRCSSNPNVSCNPVGQAQRLNYDGADIAVTIGLCLGHDILFHRTFDHDVTTLVVKDRVHAHAPARGIEQLHSSTQS